VCGHIIEELFDQGSHFVTNVPLNSTCNIEISQKFPKKKIKEISLRKLKNKK
jgi:hypothetical protein